MAVPAQDEIIARRNSPPATDQPTVDNDIFVKDNAPAIDGYYSMNVDSQEEHIEPCNPSVLLRLVGWYSHQIDDYPVLTKSIFGGCSSILGDMLAQFIENNTALREEPTEGLYAQRILAMFCTGLCYGPMLHYIYEFYEHILTNNASANALAMMMTATIYLPWRRMHLQLYNLRRTTHDSHPHKKKKEARTGTRGQARTGGMVVTGIIEGRWDVLGEEFHEDFINNVHSLWLAAIMFTGPIQIVAFRYLPLKWRTLAVNVLEVFEVMVMSYITHRNREVPNEA
ncbi:hypothetical protein ACHAWU_009256 [Discostella pseudostelligera]|uniref:Uncharacterized protein n=1 Tax=Discostella pseudostelligera TaxID=259834 RepID=A0ABD3N3P9_9STRA